MPVFVKLNRDMANIMAVSRHLMSVVLLIILLVPVTSTPVTFGAESSQHKKIQKKQHINDQALYGEPVAFLGEEDELIELPKDTYSQRSNKANQQSATNDQPVLSGHTQTCGPLTTSWCVDLGVYPLVQFPNALGHHSEDEAFVELKEFVPFLKDKKCGDALRKFTCLYLFPPCTGNYEAKLPCKSVCKAAKTKCGHILGQHAVSWPTQWNCDLFPTRGHCADIQTSGAPVPKPLTDPILKPHTLNFSSQPQTKHPKTHDRMTSGIKSRNYNIGVIGEGDLFSGWADVLGQGATNDYCRVIGTNPNLRFLSCVLAGSTNPNHHYVSRRGFEVGHRHTWFMRDMDGDGRDDYCRCVGHGIKSFVSCMKAGASGFYGGPHQAGSEFTFTISSPGPCFQKPVNPFLGI